MESTGVARSTCMNKGRLWKQKKEEEAEKLGITKLKTDDIDKYILNTEEIAAVLKKVGDDLNDVLNSTLTPVSQESILNTLLKKVGIIKKDLKINNLQKNELELPLLGESKGDHLIYAHFDDFIENGDTTLTGVTTTFSPIKKISVSSEMISNMRASTYINENFDKVLYEICMYHEDIKYILYPNKKFLQKLEKSK